MKQLVILGLAIYSIASQSIFAQSWKEQVEEAKTRANKNFNEATGSIYADWRTIKELGDLPWVPRIKEAMGRKWLDTKDIDTANFENKRQYIKFADSLLLSFGIQGDFNKDLSQIKDINDKVTSYFHLIQRLILDSVNMDRSKHSLRKYLYQKTFRSAYKTQAEELYKALAYIPNPPDDRVFTASFLNSLAWYQLLGNQIEKAAKTLTNAYEYTDLTNKRLLSIIDMNYAHIQLIQGNYAQAESLYVKHADMTFGNGEKVQLWGDIIRDDFEKLASVDISIVQKDKILAIIEKKRGELIVEGRAKAREQNKGEYISFSPMRAEYARINTGGDIVAIINQNDITLQDLHSGNILWKRQVKNLQDVRFPFDNKSIVWLEKLGEKYIRSSFPGGSANTNFYKLVWWDIQNNLEIRSLFISDTYDVKASEMLPFAQTASFAIDKQERYVAFSSAGPLRKLSLFNASDSSDKNAQLVSFTYLQEKEEPHILCFSEKSDKLLVQRGSSLQFFTLERKANLQGTQMVSISLTKTEKDVYYTNPNGTCIRIKTNRDLFYAHNFNLLSLGKFSVDFDSISIKNDILLPKDNEAVDFWKNRDSVIARVRGDGVLVLFPDGKHIIRVLKEETATSRVKFIGLSIENLEKSINLYNQEYAITLIEPLMNEFQNIKKEVLETQREYDNKMWLSIADRLKSKTDKFLNLEQKVIELNNSGLGNKELLTGLKKNISELSLVIRNLTSSSEKAQKQADIKSEQETLQYKQEQARKRKALKVGDYCSQGLVIQIKGNAALVQPHRETARNAKWIKIEDLSGIE